MPHQRRLSHYLDLSPAVAHKIYYLISQIDELKGQWTMGSHLSPQVLQRLKKSVIITSTGASTRIEGARLSDAQIEQLLRGLKIHKLITRDEQEVAGYAELLTNIFNAYHNIQFNENTIKHFHSELLKYSEKDTRHKGGYKFGSNRVEARDSHGKIIGILFDPTPPHLVPKKMQELVDWSKTALHDKTFHPLLVIANFIIEFLAIHPFQDGNGRTSRVLTNLLLLQSGYKYMPYVSHEKYIEDNKADYYLALNTSQKTLTRKQIDISPWLLFFFTMVLAQARYAIELLRTQSIESQLSAKQLLVWHYFQTHPIVTPKELREQLHLPAPTVVQILNKFLGLKKIERSGSGRSIRYTLL